MPRKTQARDEPSTSRGTKRRSRVIASDSESTEADSGEDTTFRPANNSTQTQISGSDKATLVNNMVKYILNNSATKIPMKRADISKNVNVVTKMFPDIFKACCAKLKNVYGLEVSEIQESKNSKVFIVSSAFHSGLSALQYPSEQRNELTLLFIILSYIFMKGGETLEGNIKAINNKM
jgi:hypothetical protein